MIGQWTRLQDRLQRVTEKMCALRSINRQDLELILKSNGVTALLDKM